QRRHSAVHGIDDRRFHVREREEVTRPSQRGGDVHGDDGRNVTAQLCELGRRPDHNDAAEDHRRKRKRDNDDGGEIDALKKPPEIARRKSSREEKRRYERGSKPAGRILALRRGAKWSQGLRQSTRFLRIASADTNEDPAISGGARKSPKLNGESRRLRGISHAGMRASSSAGSRST